ncbi:MAG: four-carbon acid sugar kinase family protein [Succinivibrio dextrinosolvens]|uniref:Sugar-binding N-terminal domain-containing protein n=1 Tax=Succinivibrio dextrinosolvens TaxID=83771 RepID=A0A662ZDY1_9GAMM|nr:four-carbon acid sugar kinase family protein [Succinivibrio dextrinosolvens]MDY6419598.1 four-carbon acid sugar kinase family protein [Succinivibrio dextrinosolvens]SFK48066.1 Putative sugar-binding N-terminal domain-containing protein [Succinivibrio dextrinosolvens]
MTQCVVIAVDLTGGNATGVQLKQSDFNSISILNSSMIDNMKSDDVDCIIYPTDSRAITKKDSYNRIYDVAKNLKVVTPRYIQKESTVL